MVVYCALHGCVSTSRQGNRLFFRYPKDEIRMLMGLPRFCSVSDMFTQAHVVGFHAIVRQKSASMLCRVRASSNSILNTITGRFPKHPETKEKWIDATGRDDNWFPTHHSVICSSHFEEQSFLPSAKSRRLLPTAVPTLKLRMVFDTPSANSRQKIATKKTIIKRTTRQSILQRYKVELQRYKNQVNEQQLQIKRLQTMTRRYRKKVDVMKKILDALKNENLIGEDHLWLLESDGISK